MVAAMAGQHEYSLQLPLAAPLKAEVVEEATTWKIDKGPDKVHKKRGLKGQTYRKLRLAATLYYGLLGKLYS